MCGGLNQYRYQRLYDDKSVEFIKKRSMDDCSRKAEDFDSVFIKTEGGAEKK